MVAVSPEKPMSCELDAVSKSSVNAVASVVEFEFEFDVGDGVGLAPGDFVGVGDDVDPGLDVGEVEATGAGLFGKAET
jgi:hypothetical protein